jgi:hypothetical protein
VLSDRVFQIPFSANPIVWLLGIGGGALTVTLAGWLGTRGMMRMPPLAVIPAARLIQALALCPRAPTRARRARNAARDGGQQCRNHVRLRELQRGQRFAAQRAGEQRVLPRDGIQ